MRGPVVAVHAIHLADRQSGCVRFGAGRNVGGLSSGAVAVLDPRYRLAAFVRMRVPDMYAGAEVCSMDADAMVSTAQFEHQHRLGESVGLVIGELRDHTQAV